MGNWQIEGDSWDYFLITDAINAIPKNLKGLTCEIGIRRGLGCKYIIDAIKDKGFKTLVGIDCYGNLPYQFFEGTTTQLDYTNSMRDESIGLIYEYAGLNKVNFIFMNLTDEQFFKRFADGVPVYQNEESIVNDYIFVHFDGPHQYEALVKEFLWFNDRMCAGTTMVFDDITYYDFSKLHPFILGHGWKTLAMTTKKIAYQKLSQ